MDIQKTKEYLKQVFDVEMALYTHQKVISNYKKKRIDECPQEPELVMPTKPTPPTLSGCNPNELIPFSKISDSNGGFIVFLLIAGIAGLLIGTLGFFATFDQLLLGGQTFNNDEALGMMILMLLIGIPVGVLCICYVIKVWKKETQIVIESDEIKKNEYNNQIEHYQSAEAKAKSDYENELSEYNTLLPIYEVETQKQLTQLNELLDKLMSVRENLYSTDIIYAKYRDLIAISTIYEYFASGRCSELEGPNGAYNLYENELRANIIIGSLGQIISDLQQIKNGQFALYQELHNSNKIITNLLCDIADSTRLTAYYSNVAAVAATADRYIVGMVW